MLDLVYPAWAKRPPGTKQSADFNTATGLRAFSLAFRVNRRAEHHSVKRGIITKDFGKVAGFGPRHRRCQRSRTGLHWLEPGVTAGDDPALTLAHHFFLHSLLRQKQAFQPASSISICDLPPRPKQRNAAIAKFSVKKPLIYLNSAIFHPNLRQIHPSNRI
ncbi:hypothetical protein ACL9RI_11600 [Janthinobacterium sp. Mn2066]|uniref:hypothetical protein n=1 Tax=Janthinobacterium sp. Mn2066 TaxID=3395264 RepID=UPI003BCBCE21